jgi:hypothetical protein
VAPEDRQAIDPRQSTTQPPAPTATGQSASRHPARPYLDSRWRLLAASPLYPLAHLGLARAAALTGDTAKSRKAYQDFFALWKDADPDIPILKEAQRDYDKLSQE